MHEDGTTVVNTEDPAWELALAEVAKDTNRIVSNATLAAVVAGAAEAEVDVAVIGGVDGVSEGSEGEDEDEVEDLSAAAQFAEMQQNLIGERADGDDSM